MDVSEPNSASVGTLTALMQQPFGSISDLQVKCLCVAEVVLLVQYVSPLYYQLVVHRFNTL